MSQKTFEFRCPIYGFVTLSEWEREIISQPAFQRLRRIGQLAFTNYVYPGAMHTRFEHSLGVMHMATMLYDGIVARSRELLESEFGYNDTGFERYRALARLVALLHDVGHSPFSHPGEEIFSPKDDSVESERYAHEDYSTAIIRHHFKEVINNHPVNDNYRFTADEVAALLEGSADTKSALFWRDLVTSQMDADRMDYLLRDSHHAGVDYGRYDWRRLVQTVEAVPGVRGGSPTLGVSEGGLHAAEGLIIARYFMFTQVYFHKTRVAYDHHLKEALKEILPDGRFPPPTPDLLDEYLDWDDWRVLGALKNGGGGEHGRRILDRDHYREIWHTPEIPGPVDEKKLKLQRDELGNLVAAEIPAEKSWYNTGSSDIPILTENPVRERKPLSYFSSVAKSIKLINQTRLYVKDEDRDEAKRRLRKEGDDNG
ncbi:MAG: HD domain-containing protein [Nitrospinae bacterium]|nr:HD domain-containing protein [Nitrospinota bacterium]